MTVSEEGVWLYIPTDLPKPSAAPDRAGNVGQAEYDRLKNGVLIELEVRFHSAGIPQDLWQHTLVRDAAEMMIAARILRRIRTYQDVSDSLFADANVKLRLFFEGVAGKSENGTGIEMLIIGEEGVDRAQQPWLPNANDLVDGFMSHRDHQNRKDRPDYDGS